MSPIGRDLGITLHTTLAIETLSSSKTGFRALKPPPCPRGAVDPDVQAIQFFQTPPSPYHLVAASRTTKFGLSRRAVEAIEAYILSLKK
jgi:hypothetical protein